jgi:hypothetical protein
MPHPFDFFLSNGWDSNASNLAIRRVGYSRTPPLIELVILGGHTHWRVQHRKPSLKSNSRGQPLRQTTARSSLMLAYWSNFKKEWVISCNPFA